MAQAPLGGDRHSQRLDDELVRDPSDEDETPDAELWDAPGRDGIVTDAESDHDRSDLRSAIGRYVSLVAFPAEVRTLIAMAESKGAPDEVLAELRTLEPTATYTYTADLWNALGLSSEHRF